MQTNLYFVRHAHSNYTPDELGRPLSKQGFVDALTVTELLKYKNIDSVYSSPYKRAVQTVEGIATSIDAEIQIEHDFRERVLAEKPVEDFTHAITKVWNDYEFSWEGGESNRIAQQRGVAATKQLINRHVGKNVVIGMHGNIMVLIMNYFDPSYGFEFWKRLEMPDIYKLSFREKDLSNVRRIWK